MPRRPGGWRGVGFVRVDGSHDSQERLMAVQRFRTDPNIRVALLSVTAAGVGESWGWAASI
jgi:SNF2 family DNA or RNA helicase